MSIGIKYNNGLSFVIDWFPGTAGSKNGTITAANGYKITGVNKATCGNNNDITYPFVFTRVSDQEYSYRFSLSYSQINNITSIGGIINLDVVTEKISADPTTNLKVTYNNGVTDITDTFSGQKAGTVTGTVKAGTGYTITGITGAKYSLAGGFSIVNLDNFKSKKNSDTEYSYSFTLTNDNINDINSNNVTVQLGVETEEQATPISVVTTNLAHCSVSPTSITPNEETTLTITADPGYILNGNGSYTIDDETTNFKFNNVSSYQFKVVSYDSVSVSFTAAKIDPSIDLKVTYNNGLTEITNTFSGQKAGTITGSVHAGTGYTITGVTGAYYRIAGFTTNLANFNATKISDYQYNYTFDINNDNIEDLKRFDIPVSLDVETEKLPGNINIDSTNLEHCSVSPSTIMQGKETVLTLNADSGYILNGSGNYTVDSVKNNFTCNNVSSYQITVKAENSVSITFVATKTEAKANSIVHTYILTQDDYNNLGKQIIEGVNSTATGFNQYDYTKFVNYLYKIPFKIGTEITTSTNTINLGKKNLNIDCQKVTHETFDVNLGTIDLTNVSNSHDYNPINITLYCPFSNNIALPLTVLGSKLTISFAINLKTEQATLLIKQNDNIIYSGQTELFTDLPLYFTAGIQDTLIKQFKAQYQNTIKQAYIVINYNKPITNLTRYKTTEHGTLTSYKGFTRVSHGTLKQSISSKLDNSILRLLSQGVIIK